MESEGKKRKKEKELWVERILTIAVQTRRQKTKEWLYAQVDNS